MTAFEELINLITSFTPDQLAQFLNNPVVVGVLEEAKDNRDAA